MSQIDPGSGGCDLSHYENDHGLLKDGAPSIGQHPGTDRQTGQQSVRKQPAELKRPPELARARPAEEGSGRWSAGRIAACIITAGFSELLRLAWRGIMSCCTSARSAPAPEPRPSRHTPRQPRAPTRRTVRLPKPWPACPTSPGAQGGSG